MSGPIITSKFDPSNTNLASVILALDTHQVKVQSVQLSAQSSLNTSFNLDKSQRVNNITWINVNELKLLALCLTKGSILLYSPLQNEILYELNSNDNIAILDFHYSEYTRSGWSCDLEGNIIEWDLVSYTIIKRFRISDLLENIQSVNRIESVKYQSKIYLLLGANSIYLYDITNGQIVRTFPGHIQPISSIIPINNEYFLSTAKNDRFINLYQLDSIKTKSVFVSSSNISTIQFSIQGDNSIIVIINELGNIEIFNNPLNESQSSTLSKKKRKGVISKSFNSSLKLSRPESQIKSPSDSNLNINSIAVDEIKIYYTWLENSSLPYIDSIPWIEANTLMLTQDRTIHKPKPDLKANQHISNGHDVASAKLYTEGHTIVTDGTNLIHLEDEEEEGETLAEKLDKLIMNKQQVSKKNKTDLKSGVSLTIILSQSLKNNDSALLETVLLNRDSNIISNTISRLDPYLSIILLDKLSEKLYRNFNKFDQLIYWIKWILIIHGSILKTLPNLNVKLVNLYSLLYKKSETLPKLYELENRLNLLYEQVDLKHEIMTNGHIEQEENESEDSDIEYIEEIDDAEYVDFSEDEMEL